MSTGANPVWRGRAGSTRGPGAEPPGRALDATQPSEFAFCSFLLVHAAGGGGRYLLLLLPLPVLSCCRRDGWVGGLRRRMPNARCNAMHLDDALPSAPSGQRSAGWHPGICMAADAAAVARRVWVKSRLESTERDACYRRLFLRAWLAHPLPACRLLAFQ